MNRYNRGNQATRGSLLHTKWRQCGRKVYQYFPVPFQPKVCEVKGTQKALDENLAKIHQQLQNGCPNVISYSWVCRIHFMCVILTHVSPLQCSCCLQYDHRQIPSAIARQVNQNSKGYILLRIGATWTTSYCF